jgi:hypothetical protein
LISKTKLKKRPRTVTNIEKTKAEIEDAFGFIPTEEKIWKSMQNKDVTRQIRTFLWKTTHDAYVVGTHWLRETNSQEKKERSECQHCGMTESMEHILSQCEVPGQKEVWALAKELWTKRNPDWPWPGIGVVIGASLATFKDEKGQRKSGDTRLYRILVTESAYLIWKLRCERVIRNGGDLPTEDQIRNRWVSMINARLQMDCSMTYRRYGKKALLVKTVLKTWKGMRRGSPKIGQQFPGF